METLIKGDHIKHIHTNNEYVVDTVDYYDSQTVVYTESIPTKCFPINEVIKISKNKLANCLLSILNGEKLSKEDDNFLDEKLKSMKLVTILPFDFDSEK